VWATDFLVTMTSSKTLKKIVSVGAAMLLAVGGSLVAAEPAHAAPLSYTAQANWAPLVNRVGDSPIDTLANTTPSFTSFSGSNLTTEVQWYSCNSQINSGTVDTTNTSFTAPASCTAIAGATSSSYTIASGLLGKFLGVWTKATSGQDWASYYSATTAAVQAALVRATLTGLEGSYTGSTGTPFTMAGSWATTGLTGTLSFTKSGSLQAGLSLSSTTGIISGTPVEARSATITITATDSTYASANATVTINIAATVPTISGLPSLAPGTGTIVATPGATTGSWTQTWYLCDASVTGHAGILIGPPATAINGCVILLDSTYNSVHLATITLATTYYTRVGTGGSVTFPAAVLSGKHLVFAQSSMNSDFVYSNSISADATPSPAGGSSEDATDTPITEDKRPLPVWANNVVKSIPSLTKSLNTSGGHVALTEGDYADLKSVTVGGKAITFKLEANGNVTIPVPAGEAGKTADIVIVFAGGTMTVQDGIKYVAPTDMAKVIERPIAIAAGAKKLTEAIADQIRQAAFSNLNNTTIQCVAYAAKNTSASKAAAKLTAVQACGIAAKANPALKVSEISVIVNKAKAKKQAVGIKVYK